MSYNSSIYNPYYNNEKLVDTNHCVLKVTRNNQYTGSRFYRKKNCQDKNKLDSYVSEQTLNSIYAPKYNERIGFDSRVEVKFNRIRLEHTTKTIDDTGKVKFTKQRLSLNEYVSIIKEELEKEDGVKFDDEEQVCITDSGEVFNRYEYSEATGKVEYFKDFIEDQVERKFRSIHDKHDRFMKKALNNDWNYFVTLTYDSKLFNSEEEFIIKLKNTLANFQCRYGFRYIGCMERGTQTNRCHFHLLMLIPDKTKLGKIETKFDYSTEHNKKQSRNESSYFRENFGRNDFQEIDPKSFDFKNVVNYIVKYSTKDETSFFYSRHVPTEIFIEVDNNGNEYIFCNYKDRELYPSDKYVYVFFSSIIDDGRVIPMRL